MRRPLISVIIPIYNVQSYLRECLDSVQSQDYDNLEVIMVDDGSIDSSQEIAKTYLQDSRFSLIVKENGGLSSARNVGLDLAKGEFIYFIDSDDYIDKGYLQELLEFALRFQVEFVCNDHIVWFKDKITLQESKEAQILVPDSQTIALGGAVWRCLFAKTLIERSGVRFLEGKIYEDEGFLYMVLPFCERFVRFGGRPYYYRQRSNSIMAKHKKFRSYDLLDVFEAIYLFYQEKGFLEKLQPPFYFLYDCGIGYSNEKEYLQKAKDLAKKLRLNSLPSQYNLFKMQKFLQKNEKDFLRWSTRLLKLSKIKNFVKRIVKNVARRNIKFFKRFWRD